MERLLEMGINFWQEIGTRSALISHDSVSVKIETP